MSTKMNLSFAGCGFLGIYHVGVAVCFKKYAPHLLLHRISGASAGSLAACCLLCDMPLGEMTSDFFRVVNEARSHSLGPFSPRFNIQTCLLEGLQKFLPEDAHLRVNGKLHISLTRIYDGQNVIVSHYNSREDLLQALLCACFIPVFSGICPPKFHGVRYIDGAFSDNLPTLDENTVTVSPFCGESDICPRDNSSQMFHVNWANTSIEISGQNVRRFGRILFPPRPEMLSRFCQQGFDDALNFLHRNNLISCTRCLAVQSTFSLADQPTQLEDQLLEEYDPECTDCKDCNEHRQNALDGSMPDTVLTVFQTYIEDANKGLLNWVFQHRGARLLKALSLPATLPADIMVATLTKLVVATPAIGSHVWSLSKFALKNLNVFLRRIRQEQKVLYKALVFLLRGMIHQRQSYPQQITNALQSRVAVTEYSGSGGKLVGTRTKRMGKWASMGTLVDVRVDNGNELVTFPGPADPPAASVAELHSNQEHQESTGVLERVGDVADHPDYDTFDHILQATSHHDAMYAYYYRDNNNKVKVTEIYDMTDDPNPAIQTQHEREVNEQLEYDNELESSQSDFNFTDSYDRDSLIDYGELIEECGYNPNQLNPHYWHHCDGQQKHSVGTAAQQWQQLQIEELPSDDMLFLQPEADQQQALLSEAATMLLNRPPASSYSIVEM